MGFTTLFFMWIIKPAVEPKQEALYHWSGPAANFFLPVAFDFLLLWLVLVLFLLLAARKPGRPRAAIWGGLLFFTPWFVAQTLHELDLIPVTHQLDRTLFVGAALATALLTMRWRTSLEPFFARLIDTASTILVFAGLFGVFMLGQLAFRGWQASFLMRKVPLHQQAQVAPQAHRILWIVFDELSYDQTFEHRFPGLQLPAFDALAATSTNFTNARPFDIYTEIVLPGLISGQPFDDMKPRQTLGLSVHNHVTGKWQSFDQHNTVFQDALNNDYRTSVLGWYNPYCRLLPSVLDSCYWAFRLPTNLMVPSNSISENMLGPIKLLTWRVLGVTPAPIYLYFMRLFRIPVQSTFYTQSHIDDYIDLNARAQAILRGRSSDFVLLHLPVPHPWGIYDRHRGAFTTGSSSYIDNLALADKCLSGIRKSLEDTGQWDSSTVVVMGDHSWRTRQLWDLPVHYREWTHEDDLASRHGQYDPRPAYLVKLPGQTTAARIDTPYRTVNTRNLFDAIMAHRINTPADLAAWAHSLPTPH